MESLRRRPKPKRTRSVPITQPVGLQHAVELARTCCLHYFHQHLRTRCRQLLPALSVSSFRNVLADLFWTLTRSCQLCRSFVSSISSTFGLGPDSLRGIDQFSAGAIA